MIVDLNQWKASHPPAVRLMAAGARCWWNWAMLPWGMARRWWRLFN